MSSPQDPTAKDIKFFMSILKNMKNKLEVDWNVIAQEMGLANAASASTRFSQIKKKYIDGDPAGTPSPAKLRAKKSEIGSGTNTTPSKIGKPKGRPTKKLKAAGLAVARAASQDAGVKEEVMGSGYANNDEYGPGYHSPYDDGNTIQYYDPNEGNGTDGGEVQEPGYYHNDSI